VRDVELDFGRINLFIGGNGAGKSNILEAIGVLAAALKRGIANDELARKGVRLTPPALMKSAFKNSKLPTSFRLEADFSGNVRYDLNISAGETNTGLSFFSEAGYLNDTRVFGRSSAGTKVADKQTSSVLDKTINRKLDKQRSIWDQTSSAFDFDEKITNAFDALSRYAIYSPQTEFLREIKTGLVSDPPVGLHGEGLSLAVSSLLFSLNNSSVQRTKEKHKPNVESDTHQRMDAINLAFLSGWAIQVKVASIDPLLKSTELSSRDGSTLFFVDKYMHEKRRTLSAYDSSEGTLFLLFMAVMLAHDEAPSIFAIDNIDNALNPALTKKLLDVMIKIMGRKILNELKIGPDQIFLTSHNPTTLDAIDLFDDDQRVFVVSRNDKGHTVVDRLKPKKDLSREDWSLACNGKKLSQWWIDGEITNALGISGDDI